MKPLFKLLVLLMLHLGIAAAQESGDLTLSRAVAIALDKSPAHKIAIADVQLSRAGVDLARSGFLPRVVFREASTLGNDPVYAFGTRLRQGGFTAADFGLNRLNYPDPIGNFSSRIGGEWNLFDSFGSRLDLHRAKAERQASQQQLTRTDQELVYRVVTAYHGVLLASRQLAVSEQSLKSARALLESAQARVQAGTVVESDSLAAKVILANRQQDLIRSRGTLEIARTELETVLGTRLSPGQQLADALEDKVFQTTELEAAEARALKQRSDLSAMALQIDAKHDGVKAARAAFGPRLDLFGSWQADNVNFASTGSSNWIAGVELKIDLFARDKNAKLSMEKAALDRAQATREMAINSVRLEVRRSFFELDAARQMLEVARGTVAQADEALRIVRDRYDSGLLPITELFRAEDAARSAHTGYWQAVYAQAITYASFQLATGELNSQSIVVMQ
jgi:outer membrane protein